MSEDRGAESPVSVEGGYVGILDVAVVGGLLVVVLALAIRYRRRQLENPDNLRKLSVLSR